MSTSTYSWTVMSINSAARTMIVSYDYNGISQAYNLPVPLDPVFLSEWIDAYAPRNHWLPPAPINIAIGTSGTNPVERVENVVNTSTLTVSDIKIKALIQQVLTENAQNQV